jgi:hypothetical protein
LNWLWLRMLSLHPFYKKLMLFSTMDDTYCGTHI